MEGKNELYVTQSLDLCYSFLNIPNICIENSVRIAWIYKLSLVGLIMSRYILRNMAPIYMQLRNI